MDDVTTDDGKRFAGLGGSGGGTKFGDVKMAGSACEAGGGGGSGLCFVLTRFTTVAWEGTASMEIMYIRVSHFT